MYKGVVGNDHGFDSKLFDKFDVVMSGHFHHKSTKGNINYLGAPYEMTWSDYNDPRGFHIFDTESRELTFIQNPFPMFHKVLYDDVNKTMEEVIEQDFSGFSNSFVKLIVRNKTNPYWFDIVVDKIEKTGVLDLQIVEDHLNLDLEDDADIVDEAEDTLVQFSSTSSCARNCKPTQLKQNAWTVATHSLQAKRASRQDLAQTVWLKHSLCSTRVLDLKVLAATVGAERF